MQGIEIGGRYLHARSLKPVTLRYRGYLPSDEGHKGEQEWLGIEYDDSKLGKHSGTYGGKKVFHTEQEGSGAFIKSTRGALEHGRTFVEALEERYGAVDPTSSAGVGTSGQVKLGTSGILVEAPNIDTVERRIGQLEKLREIGLDGYWVRSLGGDPLIREKLRARLKS